jgi:DNA-binding transcriptional MerR regulator
MPVAAVLPRPAGSTASPPTFTIGELAREFGVTTRAIRFYEDCGLLDPSRSGRNRVYSARDRTRLRLTLRGKRLGLRLAEVKELVDMYETRRDTGPQLRRFLAMLARHRARLEQRLGDLQATLAEVVAHEEEAKGLLEKRGVRAGALGRSQALAPECAARRVDE